MASVLIVDDDISYSGMLSMTIERLGHSPVCCSSLGQGLQTALGQKFEVVFLDVHLPDGNGLDIIPQLKEMASDPEIIIITGAGDPDGAELAVRSGAWAYVPKDASLQGIVLPLDRALQYRREKVGRRERSVPRPEGVVGRSLRLQASLNLLSIAADSNASVLITGETGTGKELFAGAIHKYSARDGNSFVIVDCGALPENLVESVLFGYEKGAFTGADRAREGLVGQADRGTLFLDEIGELPLTVQATFLRVLQEHHFRPVGGRREISSDFRLVAATNRNLDRMVEQGQFRADLLFRLRSLVIDLPPLRECLEDIEDLVKHYLTLICNRGGVAAKVYSPEFLEALQEYGWPGNVRELIQALDHAVATAQDEPTLHQKHLPPYIHVYIARRLVKNQPLAQDTSQAALGKAAGMAQNRYADIRSILEQNEELPTLQSYRQETDRLYLEKLLSRTEGNVAQASRVAGLSRSRLYALLKQHRLIS
jgi:two-component system NtrC family response regulator